MGCMLGNRMEVVHRPYVCEEDNSPTRFRGGKE